MKLTIKQEIVNVQTDLDKMLDRDRMLLLEDPDLTAQIARYQARLAELEQQNAAELADCLQAVIDEQLSREVLLAAAGIHNAEVAAAEAKRREEEGA
jgi:hypothetical protein